MYFKVIADVPPPLFKDHKLWENGILEVGKPFVLNLNSKVAGTLSGAPQTELSPQEDET